MAGVAVPAFALWLARRRVRTRLQRQLPDAYFFLARALRAGLSFEQALALAAAETPAPLAPELRRCADQLALGLAPQAALQSAAQRIQLTDFQAFVSVIGLYAAAGGNLAQLLDRLATTTRDRNQYRGYFRSATALSRITAVAIGVAPPLLFLGYVLFEPEMAHRFFASGLGLALLATAFGLELVGLIWLSYLLKVDD
jgi:tight adherence protein B